MKTMFLCLMFSGLFMAMGQTSRFTVKVLDHETGKPLSGMKVGGSVGTSIKPGHGWGTGKGIHVEGKETDTNVLLHCKRSPSPYSRMCFA